MNKRVYEKYINNLEKIPQDDLKMILSNICEERNYFVYLLANISEAVFVVQDQMMVNYVNESAKRIFSKSIEESRLVKLDEFIDDTQLRKLLIQLLSDGYQHVNVEQGVIVPHERMLNVNIIPLPQKREGVNETLVVMSDVTDRHRLRHERERNQKIQSLVDLTAGVAHEIGNPLNSINIHLSLLETELKNVSHIGDSNALRTLSVIKDETQRLDQTIKSFLEATRARKTQAKMIDLNVIVRDVCNLLRPEIESKRAQLVIRLDDMKKSLFDEEQIRRMTINILKNAIEAIPDEGLIEIETYCKEKVICLSVKDDGPGIPESALERIFDAYYTTKSEGSGLGLMLVYNIVREHGGRIEVRSQEGAGTEFNILFPVRRDKLRLPKGVSRKK